MEYARNHLNPALIIKRFKPSREDFNFNFPDSEENYDDKKKPPVIILAKESFFNNSNLQISDHICTNTKSDYFVKDKLYFLDEDFLTQLIYSSEDDKVKEYIAKKQNISLEKSLGPYETRVSPIFDKHLSTNFNNLTADEKKVILKFWDSSHLRPLKYKKFQDYLHHKPLEPYADYLISRDFLQVNFKEMIKNKEFEEVMILFIIYTNFFDKIMLNEENIKNYDSLTLFSINIFKLTLQQIPLFFHTIKNEEDLKDKNGNDIITDSNLIYIQNKNIEFILGDNTVCTIYKNYSSNIIDVINSYLIDNKIILEPLLKLSIMVVSPNNIIIKTNDKINSNNFIAEDYFVKLINSITLFNTDEWIVSKTILNKIEDIININFLDTIQYYDFFEKDIFECLISFNYDVGIKNKFLHFNEIYLDNLCLLISEEIFSRYTNINSEYVILSNSLAENSLIDLGQIVNADNDLLEYLFMRVRIAINNKLGINLDWSVKIGYITEINLPHFKYEYFSIFDFDRTKNYNLLLIHIEK